jgi:polyferredoxin
LKTVRRITQIFFSLFFIYLFFEASYPLTSKIPVDLFLRTDPLVAITTMVSSRSIINTALWLIILILLTLPLGRVFCGWVCPLGTALDSISFVFKNQAGKSLLKYRNLKYYLLIIILVASLFTLQLVWTLDPITLLTRTTTLTLFPIATFISNVFFNLFYKLGIFQDFLLQLQMSLNSTFLPEQLTFFRWSSLVLLIFLAIVGLEFISRRFWCRYLCPLGALYAFFSKFQIFKRRVSEECNECALCVPTCKMDAIKPNPKETWDAECILCYDCVKDCPTPVTKINFKNKPSSYKFNLRRRKVLTSSAIGLASVLMFKSSFVNRNTQGKLIRPPGSRLEPEFLDRCIRCHECIRVCSTSGKFLQPAFLEGGIEGFWTPIGYARTGYCEFNCVICTQVCPSGAIHLLDLETKKKTVIGLAYIDKNRCIPWYKNENCIVCQEHCPTSPKAIILKEEEVIDLNGKKKMVKRPYVVEKICIGCGICETKCPVKGESAIIVTSQGEQRFQD